MRDGGEGNKGSAVMSGGGGACAGSGGVSGGNCCRLPEVISKSSGKTSPTVSHSFSSSISIRLSLWSAWKEKGSKGGDFVGWEGEE